MHLINKVLNTVYFSVKSVDDSAYLLLCKPNVVLVRFCNFNVFRLALTKGNFTVYVYYCLTIKNFNELKSCYYYYREVQPGVQKSSIPGQQRYPSMDDDLRSRDQFTDVETRGPHPPHLKEKELSDGRRGAELHKRALTSQTERQRKKGLDSCRKVGEVNEQEGHRRAGTTSILYCHGCPCRTYAKWQNFTKGC